VTSGILPPDLIYPIERFRDNAILKCDKCELRAECKAPVLPSPGIFNVFITGESPGWQEDKYGRGFYEDAPAGELLWKELAVHGLARPMFFVNNICRCYPGKKIKTPKPEHIKTCMSWYKREALIIQPRLILAIGNTCVKAFTGKDGGIQGLSGETEWSEEFKAWICWCMHPAAVLRRGGNREYFEKGIRNFAEKFESLRQAKRIENDEVPF
jgi:DNA polymerase